MLKGGSSTGGLDGAQNLPKRRTALVVEDEPSVRKRMTDHLTQLGFEVLAVSDGDAALSVLQERRPDLICLDLCLPRISGYEVCERVREDPALQDLVVIMTSERASLEERAHSYEAGADAYLGQPYSFDKLAREVEKLLDSLALGITERSIEDR
jgi:DNA-binding response OmpR family regulator